MNNPFRDELADYVLSGHAYLHCPTTEKIRLITELKSIAESLPNGGRQLFTWSQARGWLDTDERPPQLAGGVQNGQPDAQLVPQQILDLPENALFVLKDFGFYLQQKTFSYADVVLAWLCDIRDVLAATGRTVLFAGPEFDVPAALANDITTVDFPLPDDAAVAQSIRYILEGRDLSNDALPPVISACRGMTQQQVEDRVALALRKFKSLNGHAARLILREKADILRRSGLLKYSEAPTDGLARIGGNNAVKAHISRDKACMTEEARSFGIDPPRGILLTGIPGCGKTAISLAAAAELGVPLIQFDVGAMMSKWVGESEANTRRALQQVAAMAPCVLQIDEVEKGFGSVGGDGDSGAGLRSFGTLLKWMSERTCPVYIIMTANNVAQLPPEFTRKGRIDEIFGVYLPTDTERQEILRIHLQQRNRDPKAFDLAELAAATSDYSGADIEQVVITGLKLAFLAGKELNTAFLLQAVTEVRPLSQTDPQRVAHITQWLDAHTKPAGGQAAASAGKGAPTTRPKRRRHISTN